MFAQTLRARAGAIEGEFVVLTISDAGKVAHHAVPNGPAAGAAIFKLVTTLGAQPHQNVYFAGALFKPGSIVAGKGRSEANVVALLCAVAEFDGKNDPATRRDRLPLPANGEVESSPGNFQCQYWYDKPVAPSAELKRLHAALIRAVGADDCYTLEHPWRCPGTWNWPNAKKIAEGRSRDPFRARWSIAPAPGERGPSPEGLRLALLTRYPDAFPAVGTASAPARSRGKRDLYDLLSTPVTRGSRTKALTILVGALIRVGTPKRRIPGDVIWAIAKNWNAAMCDPPLDDDGKFKADVLAIMRKEAAKGKGGAA